MNTDENYLLADDLLIQDGKCDELFILHRVFRQNFHPSPWLLGDLQHPLPVIFHSEITHTRRSHPEIEMWGPCR